MDDTRLNQLIGWANTDKWPSWEMVMYVNKVSVDESLAMLARVGSPVTFNTVKRGIEAYTGQRVVHSLLGRNSVYTLQPTK